METLDGTVALEVDEGSPSEGKMMVAVMVAELQPLRRGLLQLHTCEERFASRTLR